MSHGTILVVDDDPLIRDSVRMVLQRAGYEVLATATGAEAIAIMASGNHANTVDMLLCDLDMPTMKGTEVIAYFRKHYPAIPITVLSGAPDFAYTEGIVQQGVTDWMRKPGTRETLLEKVRVAVRLHQLRQYDSRPIT